MISCGSNPNALRRRLAVGTGAAALHPVMMYYFVLSESML